MNNDLLYSKDIQNGSLFLLKDENINCSFIDKTRQSEQEFLISTLTQLASENKRLLKEREVFVADRGNFINNICAIKENFINLLTLSQYECTKIQKKEFVISKENLEKLKLEFVYNREIFNYIDITTKLDLTFLLDLINQKVNSKNISQYISTYLPTSVASIQEKALNGFDCRPYNGPKTPPTPNSKNNELKPSHKIGQNKWSLKDMIYYIDKYKNDFSRYSIIAKERTESIEKSKLEYSTNNNFNELGNNIKGDDNQFYQNLIDRHNKSLEMIECVDNFHKTDQPNFFNSQSNYCTSRNELNFEISNQLKPELKIADSKFNEDAKIIENVSNESFKSSLNIKESKEKENVTDKTKYQTDKDSSSSEKRTFLIEEGEIIDSGDESTKNLKIQIVNKNCKGIKNLDNISSSSSCKNSLNNNPNNKKKINKSPDSFNSKKRSRTIKNDKINKTKTSKISKDSSKSYIDDQTDCKLYKGIAKDSSLKKRKSPDSEYDTYRNKIRKNAQNIYYDKYNNYNSKESHYDKKYYNDSRYNKYNYKIDRIYKYRERRNSYLSDF